MYKVQAGDKDFEIEFSDEGFIVDGKPVTWDLSRIQDGYFHILMKDRSYRAEVVERDASGKNLVIKVNGRNYPLVIKDKFDLLLEKMGMNANAAAKVAEKWGAAG